MPQAIRHAVRADKLEKLDKVAKFDKGEKTPKGARTESAESLPLPAVREVMDVRQAADYLGISADSLYRYASENTVPAFRLGNRWRFKKSRLDAWMDEQSGASQNPPKLIKPRQKKPVRAVH